MNSSDEVEKALKGADTKGGPGESSGTSADQLGVLLRTIENLRWRLMIFLGVPGAGKTLIATATGAEFGCISGEVDLGALKEGLVGSSEANIRALVRTCRNVAGADGTVLVMMMCNKIEVLPPEMLSRASGIWFFDSPNDTVRAAIWDLMLTRYGLDPTQPLPDDRLYTGREIRNVCEQAVLLGAPLVDAAAYVIPTAISDAQSISEMRKAADGRYLSVSYPGTEFPTPAAGEREPSASRTKENSMANPVTPDGTDTHDLAPVDDLDEVCPTSPTGGHDPDWTTVTFGYANHHGRVFDVSCIHCGRSGSIPVDRDDLNW